MTTNHDCPILESWIDNAVPWSEAIRNEAIYSRRAGTDAAVVEAVLALQPKRVLDVGCGEGWLVRRLSCEGIDAVGIDGSTQLVKIAQELGDGSFHCATYGQIIDGSHSLGAPFDAIVANFALLQEDLTPLLKALRNALNAKGAILIQTVHPWSVGAPYRNGWRTEEFESLPGKWAEMPWYFRTLQSWIQDLNVSGLRIAGLSEPSYPSSGTPLSLLFIAEPI